MSSLGHRDNDNHQQSMTNNNKTQKGILMSNEKRWATTKTRQTPIKHTNITTKKTQ